MNTRDSTIFVSKHSTNVKINRHKLMCEIADQKGGMAVLMNNAVCSENEVATVILDILSFNVYITGDLAFCTDVLGKLNSSTC